MRKIFVLRRVVTRPRGGFPGSKSFGAGGSVAIQSETLELEPSEEAELKRDDSVIGATPIMPTKLIKPFAAEESGADEPWGIGAIGADASAFDGSGVVVAVLDTGIDDTHPAFSGVKIEPRDFTASGPEDRQGHGTHCAGVIFGRDVDGRRIGVARGVTRALNGKVLRDDGKGDSEMVFDALQWAHGAGANIISMSLGFDFPGLVAELEADDWPVDLATSTALESYRGNLRMFDSLMRMFKAGRPFGRDTLVVAAAGNESQRQIDAKYRIAASLPAAAEDVLSVAALGQRGSHLFVGDFSNSMAIVAAPGVDVVSAWPGGGLKALSGTSMACPHAAGVAALWWQAIAAKGQAGAFNVTSNMISSASRDRLVGISQADVGEGLIKAP